MKKLYTIRPLEWIRQIESYRKCYRANVPMGTYSIERVREDCDDDKPWQSWKWRYCFDEYYDEGEDDCLSLADGKRLCEEDWQKRIVAALKEVAP